VRAAAAAPSRRQQSKWQREQHQLHLLYLAVGVIVVLVLAIFGAGLFYDNVVRANEVVAQIGPDTITAAQFVDELQPWAKRIDAQAKAQPTSTANRTQIQAQVDQDKRALPDQILNNLIDRHLIQQEADRRGLSIPTSDLDDNERDTVARFNLATNPAPTAEPTATPEVAVATVQPTLAPTPNPAISPTPFPTPTPVPTLETAAYAPALQTLLDRNSLTEKDFRDQLQQSLIREKVLKAIGEEQVSATQEQVHARHILLTTEDQAKDVLTQLQGGADFADLAKSLSTDPGSKSSGGDLGWFGRGVMDKPFEDAAFALQAGQTSDVVKGANGFHIIQVLERDPARAVADTQLQQQRQKAGTDWLDSKRSGPDVKLQLSPSEKDWVLTRLGVRP
jgi:parvulin-like peptidyl-prolyl isomerase